MAKEKEIDSVNKLGRISLIAAISTGSRALGKGGELLWNLPDDLRHFKKITSGHPVIMGRKTWESIPEKFRPLPGRTNIVITRGKDYGAMGAEVVSSFEQAQEAASGAPGSEEIFVIGGGEIYSLALPFASRLYLTLVDDNSLADSFFPEYENNFKIVSKEVGEGVPPHSFCIFERK